MSEELLGGRFRRVRALGRGAMGQVWLAEDVLLHRMVAVKSLASTTGAPPQDALERMMREARLAARLSHPNAVGIYDLVLDDGRPNVVMEYVPGDETLADRIARSGGLPPEYVASVGSAVAGALHAAHTLGITHRDIKPSNILIGPDGTPKVADFGIARAAEDPELTATGMVAGTPAYFAPEVARGAPADARSDIWSLGVTLFAALEGRSPFQHRPDDSVFTVLSRLLGEPVPAPRDSGPVGAVVRALLNPEPSARPTAADVAARLRAPRDSPGDTRVLAAMPPLAAVRPPLAAPPRAAAPPPITPPLSAPQGLAGRRDPAVTGPSATPPFRGSAPPRRLSDTPSARPARGRAALAGWIAAAVLVLGGVATAVVLTRSSGSGASHGAPRPDSASRSAVVAAPTASVPPRSTPPATPTPTPSASPTTGSTPTAPYSGPGGVVVEGPVGWHPDTSSGVPSVHDYAAPGGTRLTGAYFRIGVGNTRPQPTIEDEARESVAYLTRPGAVYSDVQIVSTTYLTFLGADAVDIEFTGTNSAGVARHARERLWIADGVTRIIQLNTPDTQWPADSSLFDQLVGSASD